MKPTILYDISRYLWISSVVCYKHLGFDSLSAFSLPHLRSDCRRVEKKTTCQQIESAIPAEGLIMFENRKESRRGAEIC